MHDQQILRKLVPLAVAAILLLPAACGSAQRSADRGDAGPDATTQGPSEEESVPRQKPPPAPEPAEAPESGEVPAGRVIDLGDSPEGAVADPETGLVAVSLRNPDRLALVDGRGGDVLRRVEIPESARHLSLGAPGGPVLVPAERSDSLVEVALPDGKIEEETPVGDFPHDADAAPNGRIFVGNEFGDTISVVENGRETRKLGAPLQPGGVAVTGDGVVGVIGVRGLTMEVFDSETLESLGRVDAGEGPTHVNAGPENRFYVTDTRGDSVILYEGRPEPRRLDTLPLEGSPYGIALDPERGRLWVTLTGRDRVVELAVEEESLREVERYPTVRQPNSVAVDTASGRVFVTGKADGQLQILDPR